jgi:hypothetical protein
MAGEGAVSFADKPRIKNNQARLMASALSQTVGIKKFKTYSVSWKCSQ